MALYYLETSALVKLYVREKGTDRLLQLVSHQESHLLAVLSIAQAEVHSAVRRRQRAGDFDEQSAANLLEKLDAHLSTKFLRQSVNDSVLDAACLLLKSYPLRAYDALQLAGCVRLQSTPQEKPVFVCADQELLKAAKAEGVQCLDPTS